MKSPGRLRTRRQRTLPRVVPTGIFAAALCFGCSREQEPRPGELDALDLERMIRQERVNPYDPTSLFDDGRAMRRPPGGTVPQSEITGNPALTEGLTAGVYVDAIPVAVTLDLVRAGRRQFETFCAPCHGLAGDGESQVARNMALRRPPSLVDARVQAFPPGRIYQVIREGYGLMRSYAEHVPLVDRWAIVAYLQALGRSRAVPLDALPPPVRERALKELP